MILLSEAKSTERTSLASRVRAGVALLDEKVPFWFESLDVARLDINQCEDCVLGQLFASYEDGVKALFGDNGSMFDDVDAGFDAFGWERSFENRKLTRLWSFVIRQRQAVSQ